MAALLVAEGACVEKRAERAPLDASWQEDGKIQALTLVYLIILFVDQRLLSIASLKASSGPSYVRRIIGVVFIDN